jgi:RHS repeat-associated protein
MLAQSKVPGPILRIGQLLLAVVLVQFVPYGASAQNVLDDTTPPGQAPGAPSGSFAISGFETVNVFNGHLNFRLPLLKVNGRGGVAYVSALPIEQRWTVDHDPFTGVYHFPNYNWWTGLRPGYGPGVLQGRQMSEGCPEGFGVTQGTTRLTFTASDGTEFELRDQIYGGQVASSNCSEFDPQAPGASRGTTFVSADGTSATFLSDATIYDKTYTPSGPHILTPSGFLMLRDGARYRIDNGLVTWMRDRNGNKISFTYEGSWMSWRITSATDSLNRQITYQYNFSDPTYGVCDRIIFKGFGGAQRIVRIFRTTLSNALISGESTDTYYNLFPTLNGSSSTYHNPEVVSLVRLPDNRTYQFRYNRYGELCRVDLPTGGRFEYSWTQFPQGMGFQPEINRRVTERRSFTETGALAGRSTYGPYESDGSGIQGNVQVDHLDFGGGMLSREKHYFHGHPFSYTIAGQFDLPNPIEGREFKTELFHANGTTILRRLENTWTTCATLAGTAINPCTSQTITTLEPATANLVSKQTFSYDSYNNPTNVYAYGFGIGTPGGLVRRAQTDYLTTNPVNGTNYATTVTIHLRSLPSEVQVFDGSGIRRARTTFEYDNHTEDANHDDLVDRPLISGLETSFTAGYTRRGNPTASTQYLLNSSGGVTGSISTYQQFDVAGNVVKAIDGRGFFTEFYFDDRFGAPDGNAQALGGSAELGTQISYAFATKVRNALLHVAYTQVDYYTGKPVDAEDANGIVSSFYHNDMLDRLTQVRRAVNTGVSNQTSFAYDDVNRTITTSSDRDSFGDNILISKTLYDGLGRTSETRQYEGGSNYIVTQQQYDALNRAFKTSNPFRPWQSESAVWTTQAFDALGRVISVTTPDNAVVSTSYTSNTVTVTDQTGKKRKSVTDALGRLIEVYEDPEVPGGPTELNYQTTYAYDVLDNLTTVTQESQQRTFVYDSLKRLKTATNPESGTVNYDYDNNSNLTQKTDARGVISTYTYDALNRNTTIDHSSTASINPDITRVYDTATNGKGRLCESYGGGTESSGANVEHTKVVSYDALGRPLDQRQRFKTSGVWSAEFQTQRGYNRVGTVTSQTYPSGRSVSYGYDAAARLETFSGTLGDGVNRNYSTEILYSPFGGTTKEKFGTDTPLYNKSFYNSRGQLSEIRVGTTYTGPTDTGWQRGAIINHYSSQCWGACSGTDNNGNLKQQDHFIPDSSGGVQAVFVQAYTYDSLNRLQRVVEGSWQQEFVYDRWGNRTIHQTNTWGTGINKKDFTVNTANNRLGVPAGQSGAMTYDNAGNLITDTYTGAGSREYDAENRMTKAWGGNNQWQEYTYNADGQRTRRKIDAVETRQVYGFEGELLAEYSATAAPSSPQKEYGYRNGQLLLTAEPAAGGSAQNVTWTNAVGVSISGNNLTRTAAGDGWNTGARSTQSIASGDGYAEFTATETNKNRSMGLTNSTSVTSLQHISYGMHLGADGQITIHEGLGVYGVFGTYTTGDTLRVAVEGGVVKYRKNGTLLRTSTVAPTYPLYAGASLYTNASTVTNAVLSSGAASSTQLRWLVTDHLGTPRMIIDQTGTLANVKRHDYLPFGEELFAPTGGRSAAQGYASGDGVRQQFTAKERDNETGLDYFLARYYSSPQGRFTSTDPQNIIFEKNRGRNADERARILQSYLVQPQNWNRYAYTRNNPLAYTDPNGRCSAPAGLSKGNVGICIEAFIASAKIGSRPVYGLGDNRGFAANDPSKTFRIQAIGTITPGRGSSGWSYDLKGNAGVSQAVAFGVEVDRPGTIKFDVKTTSIDKDGNAHLSITMTGINGFSGYPGAPAGAITLNVNLVVTPDGKVGVEGGERTAYPSVGIYVYTQGSDGQPRSATLGEGSETTIDALTKPTVPIQPVAPTCNCEKRPEEERRKNEDD